MKLISFLCLFSIITVSHINHPNNNGRLFADAATIYDESTRISIGQNSTIDNLITSSTVDLDSGNRINYTFTTINSIIDSIVTDNSITTTTDDNTTPFLPDFNITSTTEIITTTDQNNGTTLIPTTANTTDSNADNTAKGSGKNVIYVVISACALVGLIVATAYLLFRRRRTDDTARLLRE